MTEQAAASRRAGIRLVQAADPPARASSIAAELGADVVADLRAAEREVRIRVEAARRSLGDATADRDLLLRRLRAGGGRRRTRPSVPSRSPSSSSSPGTSAGRPAYASAPRPASSTPSRPESRHRPGWRSIPTPSGPPPRTWPTPRSWSPSPTRRWRTWASTCRARHRRRHRHQHRHLRRRPGGRASPMHRGTSTTARARTLSCSARTTCSTSWPSTSDGPTTRPGRVPGGRRHRHHRRGPRPDRDRRCRPARRRRRRGVRRRPWPSGGGLPRCAASR